MAVFKLARVSEVNKEWWILLLLFGISAILNSFGAVNEMLLLLYVLPTLLSAYFLGRRHATLTAFASIFLVVCGLILHETLLKDVDLPVPVATWWQIMLWGGLLVVFAYATGSLFRELHEMYRGFLLILRYFLTRDAAADDHLRRLAHTSAIIAEEMGLNRESIENVRSAALLSDLHQFELNPDIVRKLARLSANVQTEDVGLKKEDMNAVARLRSVLPIILEKKESVAQTSIETKIISVAEEFDLLTRQVDRRSALSPGVARNLIAKGGGKFDSAVVDAFLSAFDDGRLAPRRETESVTA